MSVPECPAFHEWYRAIHSRDPFPWQERLAEQVAATGEWPELVGIPTGLGKTACVDIAVWTLAHQADQDPRDRTAPTRIWWVVNRRILVDDTYRHALRLKALLADPKNPSSIEAEGRTQTFNGLASEEAATVEAVAARLQHISGGRPALQVLRLRGGDSHNRPSHPAQPAIICSTIPMYGSRVLFRGYGSSKSMRPVDAALAGTDSLVLLDEAHLAQPLRVLLAAIGSRGGLENGIEQALPTRRLSPAVASLTATGDATGNRFDLNEDDLANAEIQKRLEASKPVGVTEIAARDPAKAVASVAKELLGTLEPETASRVLVFVNTPKTALAVAKALRSRRDCEVVVATGRIRGTEARKVVETIAGRMKAGQSPDQLTDQSGKHFLVVATQTLEVGADLDADYLITEACGVRALTQRLGRLNRLGERPHARGIYVHVEPKDTKWPVYGDEPIRVLERLQTASGFDEAVDMSPGNIGEVLGDPPEEPADAPVLAEALLWEWVKTSAPPLGEAPVEPYFSGLLEQDRDVEIVWRVHVPEPGSRIWPRISSDEVVSVPVFEARKELVDSDYIRVGPDQTTAEQIREDDNGELVLRPGDTVVVSCKTGKLDSDGHWNPSSKDLAMDASILGNGLVISDSTLAGLYETVPKELKKAMADFCRYFGHNGVAAEPEDVVVDAIKLCDELVTADVPQAFDRDGWREQWSEFLQGLRDGITSRDLRQVVEEPEGEAPRLLILSDREEPDAYQRVSFDEYDELSIADPVSLDAHGNDTARIARRIAKAEGVFSRTAEVIEIAARLHDIGKADDRFQNWLDPGRDHSGPVAKSDIPRSQWEHCRAVSGWPRGGRHEELSRRLAYAWLAQGDHSLDEDEQQLLLHLVVAHHGRGRPLVAPVDDQTGNKVTYQVEGREVAADADLSDMDWDQPARFAALNRQYGFWGLALLEAVVRQADHLVSRETQKTAWEVR